jgi:chemotaxis signal transduction protein
MGRDAAEAEVLRRRAEVLARPLPPDEPAGRIRVLTFRRSGRLAVDVERVREVALLTRIEGLPDSPPFVAGLVAWRGRPILALDPAGWMAIPAEAKGSHIVVISLPTGEVAVIADDVMGVVASDAVQPGGVPSQPVAVDRFAIAYHEPIGLLLDPGRMEATLLDRSTQPWEGQ